MWLRHAAVPLMLSPNNLFIFAPFVVSPSNHERRQVALRQAQSLPSNASIGGRTEIYGI